MLEGLCNLVFFFVIAGVLVWGFFHPNGSHMKYAVFKSKDYYFYLFIYLSAASASSA